MAFTTHLVIGIEHKVSHTQVIAQGIPDQRPKLRQQHLVRNTQQNLGRMFYQVMSQYTTASTPVSSSAAKPAALTLLIAQEALCIRVTIEDVDLRARVNGALQSNSNLLSIHISPAQLLESGDLEHYTNKEADNQILTYNPEAWVKFLGEGACILRDTFSVVLHGIKTASVLDITKMRKIMLVENKALFPTAESVYSGWLSKGRAKKAKTSIVIAFLSTEDANRAIDLGLVWKELRRNAELFDKNCKLL